MLNVDFMADLISNLEGIMSDPQSSVDVSIQVKSCFCSDSFIGVTVVMIVLSFFGVCRCCFLKPSLIKTDAGCFDCVQSPPGRRIFSSC